MELGGRGRACPLLEDPASHLLCPQGGSGAIRGGHPSLVFGPPQTSRAAAHPPRLASPSRGGAQGAARLPHPLARHGHGVRHPPGAFRRGIAAGELAALPVRKAVGLQRLPGSLGEDWQGVREDGSGEPWTRSPIVFRRVLRLRLPASQFSRLLTSLSFGGVNASHACCRLGALLVGRRRTEHSPFPPFFGESDWIGLFACRVPAALLYSTK